MTARRLSGSLHGTRTGPPHVAGASAVELALVLPLLIAILLAVFDFGQAWLVQQNLAMCTREGARLASAGRPVTSAEVEARVGACLSDANASGTVTVSITPDVAGAMSGTPIEVEATRPFPLAILPRTLTLHGRTRMVKE